MRPLGADGIGATLCRTSPSSAGAGCTGSNVATSPHRDEQPTCSEPCSPTRAAHPEPCCPFAGTWRNNAWVPTKVTRESPRSHQPITRKTLIPVLRVPTCPHRCPRPRPAANPAFMRCPRCPRLSPAKRRGLQVQRQPGSGWRSLECACLLIFVDTPRAVVRSPAPASDEKHLCDCQERVAKMAHSHRFLTAYL